MEPPGQKRAARFALLLLTALGALWLARLDFARKISTNVLDLIPTDQRSPELSLVRSLAAEQQARVTLFALQVPTTVSAPDLKRASQAFVDSLRGSGLFSEVDDLSD